jgi:DNA-cytosine methyltransferase
MRYGSVCSGIEAASVAWEPLGWVPVFFAEIEPFCCALLAQRYPTVPNLGDINAPDFIERAKDLGPIDVLVGGPPCQAFSIAGLRGGLADPRGNLTLRYLAVVDALRPKFVVYENVPGILSSDESTVVQIVIDAFTQIGYICDIDIHDAQEFVLAQRRRRVFIVCVRLEDLLLKKTPTSDRIMAELAVQIWQSTWDAALPVLSRVKSHSESESQIEPTGDFLKQRMELSDALLGGSPVTKLLEYWGGQPVPCTAALSPSESHISQLNEQRTEGSTVAIGGLRKNAKVVESGYRNTGVLWQRALDAISDRPRKSTMSISSTETTETAICFFAEAILTTLLSIISSPKHSLAGSWSSDYWNLASSLLTLTKGITDYAGPASCELFSGATVLDCWGNCLGLSQAISQIVVGHIGEWASRSEVLSVPNGLQRHSPPSRETRESTPETAGAGVAGGSEWGGARTQSVPDGERPWN